MRSARCLAGLLAALFVFAGTAAAGPPPAPSSYDPGSYERAVKDLKPRAERGERDAQYWLGRSYEEGHGVAKDLPEAHKWYVLAWKRGGETGAAAKKRALALRKAMSQRQFAESRARVRKWIEDFAPEPADGVAGPPRGGIRLELVETGREMVDGRKVPNPVKKPVLQVCYRLEASGLSPGKPYRLWIWDLGMARASSRRAPLPRDGKDTPWPADRKGSLAHSFSWCLNRFMKGEWIEIRITSEDGTQLASAKAIPFPLEARDGRARIWLEMWDDATFFAYGEGFEPHEKVKTISRSNGESLPGEWEADALGNLGNTVLAPATFSRKYRSSWSVIRASGKVLKIDYRWGPPALEMQ